MMRRLITRAIDSDAGMAVVILGGTYAGIAVFAAIGLAIVRAIHPIGG